MVTPTAHWTTQGSLYSLSAQHALQVVSVLSALVTFCTSTPRTTQNSGTLATTWCSLPTSCTIAFQPITSRSTTSLQLRWWRSTRLSVVRSLLSARNTATRSREPCTQPTATTFTNPSAALMMTRSREWRTPALSEYSIHYLNYSITIILNHSITINLQNGQRNLTCIVTEIWQSISHWYYQLHYWSKPSRHYWLDSYPLYYLWQNQEQPWLVSLHLTSHIGAQRQSKLLRRFWWSTTLSECLHVLNC